MKIWNAAGKTTGRHPGRICFTWPLILLAVCLAGCASGEGLRDSGKPTRNPGILSWYQTYISPIDGDRCPMVPSCSAYAGEAFRRHGWFWGWIMTCERLIRCGRDEIHLSPGVIHNGRIQTWDPVEANERIGKELPP